MSFEEWYKENYGDVYRGTALGNTFKELAQKAWSAGQGQPNQLLQTALKNLANFAPENNSVMAIKTEIVRHLYGEEEEKTYKQACDMLASAKRRTNKAKSS